MWEEFAIHLVLGLVTSLAKNPAKALGLKTLLLHVRDSINALFPGA